MKTIQLQNNPNVYSCQVYYIRGDWNAISDVNTLIDVGTDGFITEELSKLNSGVGKKKVDQVILTHEHFDHAAGLKKIIKEYNPPKIISYSMLDGVTHKAKDGMEVKIGDREAMIFHTPAHSHDSISIYIPDEKVLFAGDNNVNVKIRTKDYSKEFIETIELYLKLDIETIYTGHDLPYTNNAKQILLETYNNIK